jgi:hypothetical protein
METSCDAFLSQSSTAAAAAKACYENAPKQIEKTAAERVKVGPE